MRPSKTLEERSLTELRTIAQGLSIDFDFGTDKKHLMQKIRERSITLMPQPLAAMPTIAEPERLRAIPPSKNLARAAIEDALQPFIARGLKLSFDGDVWEMRRGEKVDTGNVRVPLRVLVSCAEGVLR